MRFAFVISTVVSFLGLAALMSERSLAQDESEFERGDFVCDASFIVGTYQPGVDDQSPQAMAAAARRFLDSLNDEQRGKVAHDLRSDERRLWTNLPARPDAGGLRMGQMNEEQVKAVCDLMRTILSEQGYNKARDIMLADDQLLNNGQSRQGFGTEYFSVVIFGKPAADQPWGFQIDGHHLGLNVSINDGQTTISPSFIGTQPHQFKIASTQFVPLGAETAGAYDLVNSLDRDQKLEAIVDRSRGRIQAGPGRDGFVPDARGISCNSFDDEQKQMLIKLVSQWVNQMRDEDAQRRMKQIESEIDQMHFAWHGDTRDKSDISYAIYGPSLMIEYACQSLGQIPYDHLHSMYRDPTNEYGGQLDDDN